MNDLTRDQYLYNRQAPSVPEIACALYAFSLAAFQPTNMWYISTYIGYMVPITVFLTYLFGRGEFRGKAGVLSLLMGLFLLSMWFSTALSPHRVGSSVSTRYLTQIFAMAFLFLLALRSISGFRLILTALCLGTLAFGVPTFVLGASYIQSGERALDVSRQANLYGRYMAFGAIASVFLWIVGGRWLRVISVVTIITAVGGILVSGSRQASLGLVFFFCGMFISQLIIARILKFKHIVFLTLVTLTIGLGAAMKLRNTAALQRIITVIQGDITTSESARMGLYRLAWDLFKRKPIFGHGPGTLAQFSEHVYTHSTFMEILYAGGAIAFLIFVMFLTVLFVRAVRAAQANSYLLIEKRVATAVIGFLATFMVVGLFAALHQSKMAMILLAMFVWWLSSAGFASRFRSIEPK